MRLSQLINTETDVDITGITSDSRQVKEGYLFAALPGTRADGAKFIEDAINHGARAVIAPSNTDIEGGGNAVILRTDNPRLALAHAAAKFYALQPDVIAAVTGTSGKTSTVSFVQQLWTLYGITQCASMGTLGVRGPGVTRSGSLTTPDTVSLHAALADLAAAKISHLAMEASSHGLDQYRLHGVRVSAAGYTNLTRDHLDYHPDMDHYFTAKTKLFTEVLQRNGIAVLNADDEHYERLSHLCLKNGHRVISYGEEGDDIRLLERSLCPAGQQVKLYVMGHEIDVLIPLVGQFQVMNALCALGLVLAGDGDAETVAPLLSGLRGVPGRLELVPGHPTGAAVYVDYAHKPAAVEAVLNTLRPHTDGRLFCVIGCGGNRDAGKRPIMGRIASGLSDIVVITDDNPRHEKAADIRAAMIEGAPDAKEIGDRREAINWAISELREGDVLVIAGKGHEQGQIVGDTVHPFDDVTEARLAIENVKAGN